MKTSKLLSLGFAVAALGVGSIAMADPMVGIGVVFQENDSGVDVNLGEQGSYDTNSVNKNAGAVQHNTSAGVNNQQSNALMLGVNSGSPLLTGNLVVQIANSNALQNGEKTVSTTTGVETSSHTKFGVKGQLSTQSLNATHAHAAGNILISPLLASAAFDAENDTLNYSSLYAKASLKAKTDAYAKTWANYTEDNCSCAKVVSALNNSVNENRGLVQANSTAGLGNQQANFMAISYNR